MSRKNTIAARNIPTLLFITVQTKAMSSPINVSHFVKAQAICSLEKWGDFPFVICLSFFIMLTFFICVVGRVGHFVSSAIKDAGFRAVRFFANKYARPLGKEEDFLQNRRHELVCPWKPASTFAAWQQMPTSAAILAKGKQWMEMERIKSGFYSAL